MRHLKAVSADEKSTHFIRKVAKGVVTPFAFPPGNIRGHTSAEDKVIAIIAATEAARDVESAGDPSPIDPTTKGISCG